MTLCSPRAQMEKKQRCSGKQHRSSFRAIFFFFFKLAHTVDDEKHKCEPQKPTWQRDSRAHLLENVMLHHNIIYVCDEFMSQ